MGNCEFRPKGDGDEEKLGRTLNSEGSSMEVGKDDYVSNKLVKNLSNLTINYLYSKA